MKNGHLTKRQPRGRRTAWARIPDMVNGVMVGITYRVFARLSTTGATLVELRTFMIQDLENARAPRTALAIELRAMRAQVRWRRDKLDFENLGEQDNTPAPETQHRAIAYPPKVVA